MRPSHEQVCAVTSLDRKPAQPASRATSAFAWPCPTQPTGSTPIPTARPRMPAPRFASPAGTIRTNDDRVAASRPLHPQPVCRHMPPPNPTLRRTMRFVTQGWSGDHPGTQLRVPCLQPAERRGHLHHSGHLVCGTRTGALGCSVESATHGLHPPRSAELLVLVVHPLAREDRAAARSASAGVASGDC